MQQLKGHSEDLPKSSVQSVKQKYCI